MKTSKMMFLLMVVYVSIVSMFSFSGMSQDAESSSGGDGSGASVTDPKYAILPIYSADVMRNYALGLVTHGHRSVYSSSIDWSYEDSVTYTNVVGKNAEDVLFKLFDAELKYRVKNGDDKIRGYVYLYDASDNLIFAGYSEFSQSDKEKVYSIWFQRVPILSNAESAEILALAEDGTTGNRYQLAVNDDHQVLFDPWMAGAPNGLLVVKFRDGSVMSYDLSNPIGEEVGSTSERASFKVDGHHIFVGDESAIKIIELWQKPTIYIEASSAKSVTMDVMGVVQEGGQTFFERPAAIYIQAAQVGEAVGYKVLNDRPINVDLPKGAWRIWFHWNRFGQPNTLYAVPDSGGKG